MKNSQSIIIGSKKVRFLPVTRRTLMIVAKVTVKTRTIDLSVPLGGSTVVCVEIDASLAHFKLSIEVLWDWSVGEEISSLELDMDFMIESLRIEYELKDEMWDPSNWILRNCRLKYAEIHTAKWECSKESVSLEANGCRKIQGTMTHLQHKRWHYFGAETGETMLAICRAQFEFEANIEFLCTRHGVLPIHSTAAIDHHSYAPPKDLETFKAALACV